MTCCHAGETTAGAGGPHGSSAKWMIDSAYVADWASATFLANAALRTSSNIICNKCHDFANAGNTAHWPESSYLKPAHQSITCSTCHIAVPHGWRRPRLLAYAGDPAPYGKADARIYGITLENRSRWDADDCYAGCSAGFSSHATVSAVAWP